ncbi:MAG TPA: hypothetical protein VFZ91_02415 [Allosphingosinicella sp.]
MELDEGPAWGLGVVLALLLAAFSNDTTKIPVYLTAIVTGGAVLGFVIGGYRIRLNDAWLAKQCGLVAADLKDIEIDPEKKEGIFLTVTTICIAVYLIFYWYAVRMFVSSTNSASETPMSWLIVAITFVTMACFAICAVRYAGYIRMITVLKGALERSELEPRTLRMLRQGVFRREQLFEPPGNLFVTLGITATFLGLAVGLVSLDLSKFFPPPGENPAQTAMRGSETLKSLRSFVGCMGLALGMSMLGVVTAMAAQWLRGYGPSQSTDELLTLAAKRPATGANRRTAGGANKRVKPSKGNSKRRTPAAVEA